MRKNWFTKFDFKCWPTERGHFCQKTWGQRQRCDDSKGNFEVVTRPSIHMPGISKDKQKQNTTIIVEETEGNSLLDSTSTTNI